MNENDITAQLCELIVTVAPSAMDAASISSDQSMIDDLALDSITIVSLLALAEQTFGAILTDEPDELEDIVTVGDLGDFIAARQKSRPLVAVG